MKERMTLSLERTTAAYLSTAARRETNGNVSAFVEKIVRAHALAESVRREAAWHEAHPGYAEDAEIERYAAGAE
ncbi:MAG: hypothetical protein FWJ93_04095 [Micromonosporaceae bacterium]